MASNVPVMVTAENHSTSGGLFSLVAENLVREGLVRKTGAIGTDPEDFIHTGHVNDLLAHYKMTSDDIVNMVISLIEERRTVPKKV